MPQRALDNCCAAMKLQTDVKSINAELATLRQEIEVVVRLSCMATARAAELETMKCDRQSKRRALDAYVKEIESRDTAITEFDERLWSAMVESVSVDKDGDMAFLFMDGTEIHT
jgi:hypothetical protein